jgi:uncharacterized protein
MTSGASRVLSAEQCRGLLASGGLGRIALSIDALPTIVPTEFAVLDGNIVVREPASTKASKALIGRVVAFAVDHAEDGRAAWNVVVVGLAAVVDDPAQLAQLATLALDGWAVKASSRYIAIPTEHISGHAFGPLDTMTDEGTGGISHAG